MNFERGKDPKDTIGIGIKEAIKKLISDMTLEAIEGKRTLTRDDISKEIQKLTGWDEVKDISNYDYPYILKYRFIRGSEIGVMTINTRLDEI